MNVEILSRKAAERLIRTGFPDDAAVVSFYDPTSPRTPEDYRPLDYGAVCSRVFYVAVHDIDIEILGDYGLNFESCFPEADALADFILAAAADGCRLICQCKYGQSRSAACAAAVREYFTHSGIEIFADYRYYPNQLVFNKLLDALRRRGGREQLESPEDNIHQ